MIYFAQLLRLINNEKLFINLFSDLSFEIDEMGYAGMETELVDDLLFNHFGLTIENSHQLAEITRVILENQNKLEKKVKIVKTLFKID